MTASDLNTSSDPQSILLIDHPFPTSTNPWNDTVDLGHNLPSKDHDEGQRPLRTPDPDLLDPSITNGLESMTLSIDLNPQVPKDVLSQFDPLASLEEEAAREAWGNSEAHPPPPRTPPQSTISLNELVVSPSPESPQPSVSLSSSPFPSFASLARNFTIPTLSRPRPLSLDSAKPVQSPATLSSLESQQQSSWPNPSTSGKIDSPRPTSAGSGKVSPLQNSREASEVPFDFQKFLDQMKSRSAEPVSKYLKSFLSNFAKRTFTVNDQVKLIGDFLNFIGGQMRVCEVWKNASESEFDNALEGMEKLVMNRLYDFTFTPQVVHAIPPRPITTDDLERDRVLSQRIALFGWIEEKHLDIQESEGSAGFLMFSQQELIKINHYKAPRDKLICILNCCKVIFGLIRHLKKEEGADAFVPILIFVVLKANPEHLLSNVEFINRFRNPEKLQSEAGYYLSSLMGAVSFIETMDHTSLSNISQEEFENNVEDAIQALPSLDPDSPCLPHGAVDFHGAPRTRPSPHAGEESAQPLTLSTPAQTISEDAKRLLQKTGDTISKPLNAIGRIFSEALDGAEGKLAHLPGPFAPFELSREHHREKSTSIPSSAPRWSQQPDSRNGSPQLQVPQTPYSVEGPYPGPVQTPYKPRVRRVPSPSYSGPAGSPGFAPEDTPSRIPPYSNRPLSAGHLTPPSLPPRVQSLVAGSFASISRTPTPGLDFGGIEAQIDAAHEHAAAASRETLVQIFPGVDVEIMEWVLEANGGDLGKSIEALLEMSSGS